MKNTALSVTTLEGRMTGAGFRTLKRLSFQLKLSEAKTVEWALKRCGLRIKTPSKFYPEG